MERKNESDRAVRSFREHKEADVWAEKGGRGEKKGKREEVEVRGRRVTWKEVVD